MLNMEIGISTFGEFSPSGTPGKDVNAAKRVKQLLEEVKLADEAGLDIYAFGEHHRPDFVVSVPEILMAAAASITTNIRLSSSVTVLSTADPVRIFQSFSTVDLISKGRAEIIAGRGSFIESFPLFGYDLNDYSDLFAEKLELLLDLNKSININWKGKFRAPINDRGIYPRPYQGSIPVWLGVGGTSASAVRAGQLGLPMMIAILGSPPEQFAPFVQLYRDAARQAGHNPAVLQVGVSSQFMVADSSAAAARAFYPSYEKLMNRVGKDRGWSPMSTEQFHYLRKSGPLVVGSVEEAVEKILMQHEILGNSRFLAQLVTGHTEHKDILKAIELLGTRVAPAVRTALAKGE